jgi:hypothetical protein
VPTGRFFRPFPCTVRVVFFPICWPIESSLQLKFVFAVLMHAHNFNLSPCVIRLELPNTLQIRRCSRGKILVFICEHACTEEEQHLRNTKKNTIVYKRMKQQRALQDQAIYYFSRPILVIADSSKLVSSFRTISPPSTFCRLSICFSCPLANILASVEEFWLLKVKVLFSHLVA